LPTRSRTPVGVCPAFDLAGRLLRTPAGVLLSGPGSPGNACRPTLPGPPACLAFPPVFSPRC
jgi:hypothetical protein